MSTTDRIILMVQDALPNDQYMIERLASALDEEGVAGVYARQIPRESANVLTQRDLASWLTGQGERRSNVIRDQSSYHGLGPMAKYCFCCFDNVCSGIRKDVWQTTPFGDVAFGEDIDWAERVLLKGYKIVYEPAATVIHSHDRSLIYDYKRTYLCHRKLYRQFGLECVPTVRNIIMNLMCGFLTDASHVIRSETRFLHMVTMLCKIPLAVFLSSLAQFRAVRHEKAGISQQFKGV